MEQRVNELGQPIGFAVPDWKPVARPPKTAMDGRYCRVEPLAESHAQDLFDAYAEDAQGGIWTYLGVGPFGSLAEFQTWLETICLSKDPLFQAIVEQASAKAVGIASYMRIEPSVGVIEVGNINYAPRLQRTVAATEAMYLMMRRVFDELGYRRYEWKCDALNAPSRSAAERLGFTYEGLFRQALVYKGRNRDTAWYSILDREWPVLKEAYEAWLAPENFDGAGCQRERLAQLIARHRA